MWLHLRLQTLLLLRRQIAIPSDSTQPAERPVQRVRDPSTPTPCSRACLEALDVLDGLLKRSPGMELWVSSPS